MERFVHLVSKEARHKIVQVMIESSSSMRDLASRLGISATAIYKYVTGKTHPSDEILLRILEIASYSEKKRIARIIEDDLARGLRNFIEWGIENNILSPADIRRLEDAILKASLAIIGKRTVVV